MHITSLEQAEQILLRYVPAVKAFTGKDVTIDRIKPIMDRLDNPQNKLRIVHIAGTSGKTSTSYYIASLLYQTGKTVGMTVSPHIDSVTERIQINGKPISDKLFCDYLGNCLDLIYDLPVQPSYFELLMALAYWIFFKEGVDYAVIETGMGGLHDGSNVADRADKVCVITDIGYDHMHILGDTIPLIAAQKAGIIHTGNSVFMYKQSHEVMSVIRQQTESVCADTYILNYDELEKSLVSRLPDFQKRNFLLANYTVQNIIRNENLKQLSDKDILFATKTYIPGRMDIVQIKSKTIIMDGAHNGQKSSFFVSSYKKMFNNQKAAVVLALKDGKEYSDVLNELKSITSHLIVTTFNTTQDLPSHAIDPELLSEYAIKIGFESVEIISDNHLAYMSLLDREEDILVITGSFYMLSQLRHLEHLQHNY